MTEQMESLYNRLITVEVKNLAAAYSYLADEMNQLDSYDQLAVQMTRETYKNTTKGYKKLKLIVRGKSDETLQSVYEMYDENTNEYFFLKCLVKMIELNKIEK